MIGTMLAYLGPGGGFAILVGFLGLVAAVAIGALSLLFLPVRVAWRRLRSARPEATARFERVVVVGMDGLDPERLEAGIARGDLPHFQRLAERGSFHRLGTTLPAVSPVAWASFQTGTNPGKHRIYDFLHRDRRTHLPRLSTMRIDPPRRHLRLGRLSIPLGRARVRLERASRPFWSILGDYGIFSQILNVPTTFPPEPFFGVCLAGMDVPDLRGSQGTFTVFETATGPAPIGGERRVVERNGPRVTGRLIGPADPLRPRAAALSLGWSIDLPARDGGPARLAIGTERVSLEIGRFSGWIPVAFRSAPWVSVRGMVRFLLRATDPFQLYVSPIHVDPLRPVLPISHPLLYSIHLALRHGRFPTLGQAEDTWAANQGFLSPEEFLDEAETFHAQRSALFLDALARGRRGLVAFVYDHPDRVQHLFHREAEDDPDAVSPLPRMIRRMDRELGRILDTIDENTLLLVLSDHGFGPFRRQVDLNAWLLEEGYLARASEEDDRSPLGVDWTRTRAHALGMGGISLNLRGRDARGIVSRADEAGPLLDEIADRLRKLVDPDSGEPIVRRVHRAREAYQGPYVDEAPDLIVGFERGYRSSWGQVAGRVSETVVTDNDRPWGGDHAFDPETVPGILLSNHPLEGEAPHIQDIAPTVLEAFGVAPPAHIDGRSLLARGGESR
jgi:predicted AlkP superfamily phosphohydrolase/phosphomutase